MSNTINKIFVDKMGGRSATEFIGTNGDIFYDTTIGDLRLSDGVTPGGKALLSEQFAGAYRGYQAGVNFFRNGSDPEIAQVIIHNAEGRVDYINYTADSEYDDFYATNLLQSDQDDGDNRADKIIVLNLYGSWRDDKRGVLSINEVRTFVRKFIDVVLYDEEDTPRLDLQAAQLAFYSNIDALTQSLPAGALFENFIFDDNRRVHWPEYNVPEGRTPADLKFHLSGLPGAGGDYSYSNIANVYLGNAGSGFEMGDTIVINGGQLGGNDEVNDLTLTVTGVKSGGVTSLELINGGSGFFPSVNLGDYELLNGGEGFACGIYITQCDVNGAITGFELRNGGGNSYSVGDTLTLNFGGDDATFEVLSVGTDQLDSYTLDGTAYVGSPSRTLENTGYWPRMFIHDGGDDQYDNGNWISTNVSTNIVIADIVERKMTIAETIKSGVTLLPGMRCTAVANGNTYTFRLLSQALENPNVWYINNSLDLEYVTVRIDGIPYANGDVIGSGAFGETSHVVVYDKSIFAMMAFDTYVDSVYYNGNMGANSRGYKEVSTLLGARTVDYTVKSIPQTRVYGDYNVQTEDAGKHIYYNGEGQHTIFLTAEVNAQMPIGTAITIVSGEDGWTYIRPADENIKIWGVGPNFGYVSNWWYIQSNSIATLLKVDNTKWILSGANLGDDD